jgi:hypothetical protein
MAYFRPMLTAPLKPKLLRKGKISGIYYDALQQMRSRRLQNIGIMYDPNQRVSNSDHPQTHDISPNDSFTCLAAPMSGTFFSRVVLKDVSTIRSCYVGGRCTGLTLTFAMGIVETLGQWFECIGSHNLLFDSAANDGFQGLQFELDGQSHLAVVRRVTVLHGDNFGVYLDGTVKRAKYSVSPGPNEQTTADYSRGHCHMDILRSS